MKSGNACFSHRSILSTALLLLPENLQILLVLEVE